MTPKADRNRDLIEARVLREREWAHAAWLSRLSWGAMRRLANLPEVEGGLGYDLSEQALKGLVLAARNDRGDMAMGRDERIERQAAEVDERARSARHDFAAAYSKAAALDRAIADFEVYDMDTAAALRALIQERTALAYDLERADRRLDSIHAREAKLFGLDAPTEAKLEVTSRDAVADELNAMLERAGRKTVTHAQEPGE